MVLQLPHAQPVTGIPPEIQTKCGQKPQKNDVPRIPAEDISHCIMTLQSSATAKIVIFSDHLTIIPPTFHNGGGKLDIMKKNYEHSKITKPSRISQRRREDLITNKKKYHC